MFFPVLGSGAAVQYPFRRATYHDLVETTSPGGSVSRARGESEATRRWRLRFEDLTDAEAQAILALHEACGGGWRRFTFLDPLANLLAWSEDLNAAVWEKAGGVSVTSAMQGDGLMAFTVTNASQAQGGVRQRIELPAGSACTLSCELRGAGGGLVWLAAGNAGKAVSVTGEWRQAWVSGEAAGGEVGFGVELAPGGALEVRHVQAQAQAAPTAYQPSYERGGVCRNTRFEGDGLRVEAAGPGRNRVEVTLVCREEKAA